MMRCNTIASDYTNKFSGMEDRRTSFNHIYACHNRALGHRNNSATNVTAIALQHSNSENSFNCLKDLMLAHFYLVSRQQSNSIMIKEKLVMTLMIENEQLKAKVKDNSKQLSRKKKNPPPLIPITSTAKRSIPPISAPATAEQCTDLVVTDLRGTDSTFVFETGVNKNTGCSISKPYEFTTTERTGLSNWAQQASMFEQSTHKQKLSAKSVVAFDKMTPKSDVRTPPSTVTAIIGPRKLAGSGNTTAQFYKSRNANNHPSSTCTSGSLGHSQGGKKIECTFAVNKDSTMVQTYRKSNTITPKSPLYTGSFANRLKLIETTPSDEDPYQLREADMREQSPILKLTHRKSSITRTKLFGEDIPSKLNKSIYDFDLGEKDTDLALQKIKLNKYNLGTNYVFPGENDDEASKSDSEKCSDVAKTEPSIWQEIMMNEDKVDESICDFSYDENPQNLSENATFNSANFGTFFSDPFLPQPDDKCDDIFAFVDEQSVTETKKTQATFLSSSYDKYLLDGSTKSTSNSKMSNRSSTDNRPKAFKRKYSNSTETTSMATVTAELPPLMVDVPYYTSVGTDDWWLAGVHPDLMPDGHEPPEMPPAVESLEVPRWRTKQFNSTSTLEGTENLDEKVFKKRHLKQETKERRWKRWDDQQLREQKYVEHLRIRQHEIKKKQFERLQSRQRESQQKQIGRLQSRQRESQQKQTGRLQSRQREAPIENRKQSDDDDSSPVHTFHPQPHLHVQYIELTDAIPLSAFGEAVPAVPECEFALPWIRVSKPFKKCKSASLMKNYNPKIL